MNISGIQPNSNATLEKVTVTSKPEARSFDKFGKKGRVTTARIKDDTGECDLTLWNDDIEKVNEGDTIKLTDCWVKEWNGKVQISTGKNGKIEKI